MAYIAKLPNEILLDIFEYLKLSSRDLLNVMLCSRSWRGPATSILYNSISLASALDEDSPVSQFAKQCRQFHLVQSIAIQLTENHLMGFSIASSDAFARLWEICDTLSSLLHLQSFSLFLDEPIGHGHNAPSTAIVHILNNLPQTVVNLSIDCDRLDTPSLSQPHVCHAISVLVPRLKTLRLRLSYVCSGLFSHLSSHAYFDRDHDPNATTSQHPKAVSSTRHPNATTRYPDANATNNSKLPKATSALEHLVIRLEMHPDSLHGPTSCLCYSGHKPLQGVKLAKTLQKLCDWGAFPSLRRWVIVEHVDGTLSLRDDHSSISTAREVTKDRVVPRDGLLVWTAGGFTARCF
ncbi:hypothetical protein K505DRAFT_419940 [Melanomma pulvis-pyrius CBS 109.77]|uniref:F-box domain-containing protein n=1 Tax=Melanomma pulvis-pyrius CBS 109.77 TaxID=1314802 RepID=A0A6A6X2A0_9PLEO|nr:hypothetical protein K505DRAFT_419940 [Melanomma pulvis-pyrius CBS 109.77]